jgi:hypothetical protein
MNDVFMQGGKTILVPMPQQVGRALRQAADNVERLGWAKGTLRRPNGSRCVRGHLEHVGRGVRGLASEAERVFAVVNGIPEGGVPKWNDKDATSADEVRACMLKAADYVDPVPAGV